MHRTLRKVVSSLAAVSFAFAMLSAAGYDCPVIAGSVPMESGTVEGAAHDCGDPQPTAPVPGHHECKMLTSCTGVSFTPTDLAGVGDELPRVRPDVLDDARPGEVLRAPVAPPPRA